MNKGVLFLSGALIAGLMSSCLATPPSAAPSTLVPPATATTTVAFPTVIPSSTWTPGPTSTPTSDNRPGIGPILLTDSFDDPSAWDLPTTATGAADIRDGELTLAVRAPHTYQGATRASPAIADFYAEVEVLTKLCNPGDEYGLTVRGNELGEHYRLLIGCDGTARLSRVLQDGSRALTLRVATPAIATGAPAVNRIAVWAHGLDLKLFVNGDEVVAARDAALGEGTFGFIARAGSGGQVAVAFDDLIVRALSVSGRTPTPATAPPP